MQYELVVAFATSLEQKQAEEKLTTLLSEEGFTVSDLLWWGKKFTAYPLNKKSEANYLSLTFEGKPMTPKQLEARFRLDDTVLRTLILKKEERKQKNPKS